MINLISSALTLIFPLAKFFIEFMGNKKKAREWLQAQADALYEKGWMTAAYIVDLEEERSDNIDNKLDKMNRENQTGQK
jgi:hypothetical protein